MRGVLKWLDTVGSAAHIRNRPPIF